jgi:3-oxoacyl-[acyl-carrier-protein] synthase II
MYPASPTSAHPEHTRRVVITGLGVISPNGNDLKTFWDAMCSGRSAAGIVTRFDIKGSPCRLAAEVQHFDPAVYMDQKSVKRFDRSLQYGLAAAYLAASDANLNFQDIDPDRTGVVEATSLSNMEGAYKARAALDRRGPRAVTPSHMLSGYFGSGSAEIAQLIGCQGHAITCSSSSASGNDVIGYAVTMIQNEDVDVMITGGAEAPIVDTVYFGFAHSGAMTRWAGSPDEAMRPFDQRADGFVMGEGGAYLVLEELGHALSRGAKIYAEVLGQGRSCEAFHPMAPHPDGVGVARAMEKALRRSGIERESVDYVNAHGTANNVSDLAEIRAIKRFFGTAARRLAVSSTKPITGHPLAAAGALEAVIVALALKRQVIPPTLNVQKPLAECDLDLVPLKARPYPIRVAMSLNSGFGGKTSCLLLGKYPQ